MSIDEALDINIRTKDPMNISYNTPHKGYEKNAYIHNDINLQKRMPSYQANTNKQQNVYKQPNRGYQKPQKRNTPLTGATTNNFSTYQNNDINNRNYILKPTITVGGMEVKGAIPTQEREDNNVYRESSNQRLNRQVAEMSNNRNNINY
jgi:hypothetical protein